MTRFATQPRPFQPGTTGWTARDLDDPQIEQLWENGRYEIVEGVLTTMAPAYFTGGNCAFNLAYAVKSYLREHKLPGRLAPEADIVIDEQRVVRADAVLLLPADEQNQLAAAKLVPQTDYRRTRILIPPTLVIESLSPGHESHDRQTKRRWYAEFGIANYWLVDGFKQTLECLMLRGGTYNADAAGKDAENLRPSLFPGLSISLKELWTE